MQTTEPTPVINCYIVELDEKHFNGEKITARFTNTQRFSDEDTLRARSDAVHMLLSKQEGAEEIKEKDEFDPEECNITVKLFMEFFFVPEMGDAEVYKPVQLPIFDNDNLHSGIDGSVKNRMCNLEGGGVGRGNAGNYAVRHDSYGHIGYAGSYL
jgi:hypothetical protein